jgi:autotransporter-associated beta strand protein
VNYNNQGGLLVFDGNNGITTATLGGLTGGQNLGLTNLSGSGVTLTVGNNNTSTTYSGNLNDGGLGGSLMKAGTGTFTLTGTNNSYNLATTVSNGVLRVNTNGVLNTGSASIATTAGAQLIVSGGSLTATNSSNIGGVSLGLLVSSGSATFLGPLTTTLNQDQGNLISVTGGSLTAASLALGRTVLNDSTQPTTGSTTAGLYVNGGAVNIIGNLDMSSSGSANSSASARVDSGSLTVGGVVTIGLNNGGRWSVLDVNGGSLTVTNATTGISVGGPNAGNAELLIRAGTSTAGIVSLGYGTVADTDILNLTGGSLYLGSGGIVQVSPAATATITLTGGILGAATNWSSTNNMQLGSASIQAADTFNAPQSIALSGILSGTNLVKTGTGTLTLSGANIYTGATSISNGILALSSSGSISNTARVAIGAGATFDVSALGGYTFSGASPVQTLAGISTSGTANVNVAGNTLTLASGATGLLNALGGNSPTNGKISVAGNLALNANAITINVNGGILGAGNYRLLDCTGTLSGSANSTPTFTGLGATPGASASIATTTGAAGHVDLTVGKATPALQTATATSILLGQALSNSTLNVVFTNAAGGNVPGTFAFTSPGTVPAVGTANQQVQFTPTDTTDYNTPAAFNVAVTVISPVLIPTNSAGITGFNLLNGNVVINGTNGQSGGTYYLLASTNLSSPVGQWTPVATNVVSTNGPSGAFTFTGTNAAGSNAGNKFYILSNTNN